MVKSFEHFRQKKRKGTKNLPLMTRSDTTEKWSNTTRRKRPKQTVAILMRMVVLETREEKPDSVWDARGEVSVSGKRSTIGQSQQNGNQLATAMGTSYYWSCIVSQPKALNEQSIIVFRALNC